MQSVIKCSGCVASHPYPEKVSMMVNGRMAKSSLNVVSSKFCSSLMYLYLG